MFSELSLSTLLELIEEADACATPLLILILVCVGGRMVNDNSRLRHWGLRLAAGAFIAYAIYGGMTYGPTTAEDWVDILIHAFVAGGLLLGVSWIILAISQFVYRVAIAKPVSGIRQFGNSLTQSLASRRSRRQERNLQRKEQLEWQHSAPGRERAAQEATIRANADAERRADVQKRRELARMDCELLWIAYAPAIQQQFGKQDLETFLGKYMGDNHIPEFVEERATALKTTLTTLYTSAQPMKRYKTVEEAITGFERAKQRISQEHFGDPEFQEYLNLQLEKIKGEHLDAVIKNMGA